MTSLAQASFIELRREHSGDFLRLQKIWQHQQGHAWIFAQVNAPIYREALIEKLEVTRTSARITLDANTSVWDLLTALQAQTDAGQQGLHLVCDEGHIPSREWWQHCNTQRDRFGRAFAYPVVWWLPETVANDVQHYARDLWNWREMLCDFVLRDAPLLQTVERMVFDGVSSVEKQQLMQRLAEIAQYLHTVTPGQNATPDLRLEAARAHQRLGEMGAAFIQAELAVRDFENLGNELNASFAKGKIADILQARGDLDEALRIRQEDELPVYEKLGEVREIAITKGQIADILQARGDLDEALRIRYEEQLPVYEKLGDLRSLLVAQANIALALLQRQGEGDRPKAQALLSQALMAARAMRLPEAAQIEQIMQMADL